MAHEDTTRELLNQVRVAAAHYADAADAIGKDLGVTGAMREVLMRIAAGGGNVTVPHVARLGGVSRQHVQMLVNELRARGLTTSAPNPLHARSSLVVLTPKGRAVVETVRECEDNLVTELASELPSDVATALAVLRRLNAVFHRRA